MDIKEIREHPNYANGGDLWWKKRSVTSMNVEFFRCRWCDETLEYDHTEECIYWKINAQDKLLADGVKVGDKVPPIANCNTPGYVKWHGEYNEWLKAVKR